MIAFNENMLPIRTNATHFFPVNIKEYTITMLQRNVRIMPTYSGRILILPTARYIPHLLQYNFRRICAIHMMESGDLGGRSGRHMAPAPHGDVNVHTAYAPSVLL